MHKHLTTDSFCTVTCCTSSNQFDFRRCSAATKIQCGDRNCVCNKVVHKAIHRCALLLQQATAQCRIGVHLPLSASDLSVRDPFRILPLGIWNGKTDVYGVYVLYE